MDTYKKLAAFLSAQKEADERKKAAVRNYIRRRKQR